MRTETLKVFAKPKAIFAEMTRDSLANPFRVAINLPTITQGVTLGSNWKTPSVFSMNFIIPVALTYNRTIEVIDTSKQKLYTVLQFKTGPTLVFSGFGPGTLPTKRRTQNGRRGSND